MKYREYKHACRYFNNEFPCKFHKEEGVECDNCSFFSPVDKKIIILKLDAVGDILRTTFILPALKERYPSSHITWLTRENAAALFYNNKYVDEVLSYENTDCLLTLQTSKYDICINPDASPASARLTLLCNADKKIGFIWDEKGYVAATNDAAQTWYDMGLSDTLKKANKNTYQSIVANILNLDLTH